ncbi:ABC transporter ATP-binding protein [Leifsonia poae]|uniref:ABC transporter ATP-binding protein n=1 Tax=Leifsonia poae TaxID=110933 RepID=UPI001CC1412F|nr:ABC transporter ATP-binding protein [Leifsonia poae]
MTLSAEQSRIPASTTDDGAKPILEIRNLSVDYGYGDQRVHALRNVSLTLREGEVLGLAGESGCGKSTLVYGATRLLPPPGLISSGEVLYYDESGTAVDILRQEEEDLRASRWQDTAIVFQGAMNSLNPVYRIGRQITDAIAAHRPESTKRERDDRARELLSMVGIASDRLRSYPHQLSGGMRQRVMIAMALALEPRVLIMDEPTTALDVVMQRQIVEQIVELRERLGFSVIFITHDVSLLIEIADRIAIMYAGDIVEQGPAAQLYREPRHPYTRGLLNSFPPLHGPRREMTGIPGSPPDLVNLPTGCAYHPRCPYAMDRCRVESPSLLPPTAAGHEPGRLVSCWLDEDPAVTPPPELSLRSS